MRRKGIKGQEEMIGFALIIIIVAVILLVFLGISLRQPQEENVKSYEVENFLQATLQYTGECRDDSDLEFLSIRRLITACGRGETCLDGKETCMILETDLREIMENSWKLDGPIKAYELKVVSGGAELFPVIKQGNLTGNCRGALQDFNDGFNSNEIRLQICD